MRQFRVPPPHFHRSSGQARVRFRGTDYYLGPWDSPGQSERYAKLVAELAKYGTRPKGGQTPLPVLVAAYLQHADGWYRKNGQPTTQLGLVRTACQELLQAFGDELAQDFGPKKLGLLREAMAQPRKRILKSGQVLTTRRSRRTINGLVAHVVALFRWGAEQELVTAEVWHAVAALRSLRKGRCDLPEGDRRQPVAMETVEATLPHLAPPVAAMVRLQQLTSARPGEICILRPCDVDRDTDKHGGCWLYRPESHKTEHCGKLRLILLGPRAQAVLTPFLERVPDAYCFSPVESVEQVRERREAARQTPPTCGNRRGHRAGGLTRKPERPAGERYTTHSYRRAIDRACERAGVDVWTPHQLRHTRTTELEEMVGLNEARAVNGHAKLNTTLVYAHADAKLARKVMAEHG